MKECITRRKRTRGTKDKMTKQDFEERGFGREKGGKNLRNCRENGFGGASEARPKQKKTKSKPKHLPPPKKNKRWVSNTNNKNNNSKRVNKTKPEQ